MRKLTKTNLLLGRATVAFSRDATQTAPMMLGGAKNNIVNSILTKCNEFQSNRNTKNQQLDANDPNRNNYDIFR